MLIRTAEGLCVWISPARYSKNMMAVRCESDGSGFKTRHSRLADAMATRYTHREHSYLMSRTKAEKFRKLLDEGWDASSFSGKLIPPDERPVRRIAVDSGHEYIPLPHCRHRATAAGPNQTRQCCHCGARTFDDYWSDGWDEPRESRTGLTLESLYGIRPGVDCPATR